MLRVLLKKELTDSLRDRRTLMVMILLPILLYPGVLMLTAAVSVLGQHRLANEPLTIAVASDDAAKFLAAQPVPEHTTWARMAREEGEAQVREKNIWAVVDAPAGSFETVAQKGQATVTVLYTKRSDFSVEALSRLRTLLEANALSTLKVRLREASLPESFAEPVLTEAVDIDFQKNVGPLVASRILPVVLLMMCFLGALYPALDVSAGEKERGTLETLLVAPVSVMQVMIAKYVTVVVIAVIATLANLGAMAATFAFNVQLDGERTLSMHFSAAQIITMLSCLIPAAMLAAGVCLAVASLARNFKEGQSLMTPVTLLASTPGIVALMPGIELNAGTALIPLVNVSLMIKAVVLGAASPVPVLLTIVSTVGFSLLALRLAAKAFASETLRFGGVESWGALFRLKK